MSVEPTRARGGTDLAVDRALRASRPLDGATVAGLSRDELVSQLASWHRLRSVADGTIVLLLGEVMRREDFRPDGAATPEDWQVDRFGLSVASARNYRRVAERACDLPHLSRALSTGDISLDKMQAVVGLATPEADRDLAECALEHTVAELRDVVGSSRDRTRPAPAKQDRAAGAARFNEACHTMSVQFPAEEFSEVRSAVEASAKSLPTDGQTPWDLRQYDAFLGLFRLGASGGSWRDRQGSPYFTVLHAPLDALLDANGATSELAGDLERGGLVSVEAVRRVACDATVVIAVDDKVGHTMYEGRARRDPTGAQRREIWRRDRCCRFPGCSNALFTEPHHLDWWSRGGRTDVSNLALLCKYHHALVHSKGWTVTGDANGEIVFVGPTGRRQSSRPSPRWTAITQRRRAQVTTGDARAGPSGTRRAPTPPD